MEKARHSEASYRHLDAWGEAIRLAKAIYVTTQSFPTHELYGLTQQLRRAAISVPSNIAEGHGRQTKAQFLYFTRVAKGSLAELETQMILAHELEYLDMETLKELDLQMIRVGQLLNGLLRHLVR